MAREMIPAPEYLCADYLARRGKCLVRWFKLRRWGLVVIGLVQAGMDMTYINACPGTFSLHEFGGTGWQLR